MKRKRRCCCCGDGGVGPRSSPFPPISLQTSAFAHKPSSSKVKKDWPRATPIFASLVFPLLVIHSFFLLCFCISVVVFIVIAFARSFLCVCVTLSLPPRPCLTPHEKSSSRLGVAAAFVDVACFSLSKVLLLLL